jgi:hypothetical protein
MKKNWIALGLALAMLLSLCGVTALAEESDTVATVQTEDAETPSEETVKDTGDGTGEAAAEESAQPVNPDQQPETGTEDGGLAEGAERLSVVSFADVKQRMQTGNLQILALQESVDLLENIDYEDLKTDLLHQLSEISSSQSSMVVASSMPTDSGFYAPLNTYAYAQLQTAYEALQEQLDDIRDGKTQTDNAGTIRQLQSLQNQIIMAGEATYVALLSMETQEAALQRQLTALDRTVEEMELRYQLGQVSALQLSQTKAGRTSLASGLETLQMNIKCYKYQLELMLGAEMTGTIQLSAVSTVTEREISAMDLDADLASARANSYELYDAAKTLEDAREDYKDTFKDNEATKLTKQQAQHTWNAAQITYENTTQDYERRFRVLYDQVKDYKQILDAAQVSLACEQSSYAASELKYQQGAISQNALLDAQYSLKEAEEKVTNAATDLFSSYNTYCWAVESGILN